MGDSTNMRIFIAMGVIALFGIITFALAAATLGTLNSQFKDLRGRFSSPTVSRRPLNSTLAESIRIDEVMAHLNELQRIANAENGTRAIGTPGFNRTLTYIAGYLRNNTNLNVTMDYFPVRQFSLVQNPTLTSSISGVVKNYTYSDAAGADFYHVRYSTSVTLVNLTDVVAVPNLGCSDADWLAARPPPAGRVALVKRGGCTFPEKGAIATKYNVTALLLYNDGTSADRRDPIEVGLGQENRLPALFLSFIVGQTLANASLNIGNNAGIRLSIDVRNLTDTPVGNICADTPTGDVTQTIVIGSHTDSVPAGPGINDNGSGSAANLALAVALARLFQTSSYATYQYRVRFCWWGAEEVGLLGSVDHVAKAKLATVAGERIRDYLINLNFDMLASPNFFFGIYDGRTARNDTPPQALPGSNKITALFRDWFSGQNLPWDNTDFSGRSDYGPFLAEGIVAGGLFTGADELKTEEQRLRYDRMLSQGMGGAANILTDPCYHRACDSIQNINVPAYEKMVQAAAYMLEVLGRQANLRQWLYPNGRVDSPHAAASTHTDLPQW